MDYKNYHFNLREIIENLFLYIGLAGCISYLFYRSVLVFLILLPFFFFFLRFRREGSRRKRQRVLSRQFLDAIQSVSVALNAGYSVETSFSEALKELKTMYKEDDMIVEEMQYIVSQLHMNRNLEELLLQLAVRSGIEDIRDFADVFAASKRTGGNMIAIIRNTVLCISQKEETRLEIQTGLSAKRLEQTIMSFVPCMILLYVQMMSPGFLDVMYGNPVGIIVMTICLCLYGIAWYWGRKIVDIEV